MSTPHDASLFRPESEAFVVVSWRLIKLVGYERATIASHIAYRTHSWDRRTTYEQDGHQWWNCSMIDMERQLHMLQRTIGRHLQALVDGGYLIREQHRRGGPTDQSYSYRPNIVDGADSSDPADVAAPDSSDMTNGELPSNGAHSSEMTDGDSHSSDLTDGSSIKKEITNPREREEDRFFKEFFEAFPRKVDLPIARSVWRKVRAEGASPAELIAGAQRYAASTDVVGHELRYVQKPHNWLHAHGWENEYTPAGGSDRSYIDKIPVLRAPREGDPE